MLSRIYIKFFFLFVFILINCGKGTIGPDIKAQQVCGSAGVCWEISEPKEHPFIHFDVNAGIARYQGNLYKLGGNGSTWDRTSYQWEMWKGSDVDNMVKQSSPIFGANFPNYITNNCDANSPSFCNWQFYWPMGLYIDNNGVFYTIAYTEYNFKNGWLTEAKERRLGLAKSFDEGKTWNYFGDIITQDKQTPAPANKIYNGAGDITFFLSDDGYAYIYYKTGFYDKNSLIRDIQNISVARSPIDQMFEPGSWKKFYNGAFTEPGINGKEEYIFTETDAVTITYNTYLKKYVLFGGSVASKSFITFCDDLNKQKWTPKDFAIQDDIRMWYFWVLDPLSNDVYKTGQTFRIYTTGLEGDKRTGNYKDITFSVK